ncbi:hypothetical protein DERP_002132 [Dermatophagoides pteronyssinus]|uniref:Uncharacterized protein n=1 Tax=Dermatophagoides pteronyssinus TaxID=6956 RepID=A0ABQ8JHC7_DERPT|nr:hypothetical protein DERP_002132 [Dermatophagoides pteronyssinus]
MKRRTETMDFRHYRPNFEKCYNDHHQQTIMSSKLCSKQNFSHKSITKCLLIILFTATITLIEAVIEERVRILNKRCRHYEYLKNEEDIYEINIAIFEKLVPSYEDHHQH